MIQAEAGDVINGTSRSSSLARRGRPRIARITRPVYSFEAFSEGLFVEFEKESDFLPFYHHHLEIMKDDRLSSNPKAKVYQLGASLGEQEQSLLDLTGHLEIDQEVARQVGPKLL